MLESWLLVLILHGSAYEMSHSTLYMENQIQCIEMGDKWVEEMTIIINPDSSWSKSIKRTADYKCIKLPNK